jgi:hypothetical protein
MSPALRQLGRLVLCLSLLLAAACDRGARRRFCRLGAEHEVARTSQKQLDAIELVTIGSNAVALWSEPGGLFARRLDGEGRPRGERVRLGARCEGGLVAAADAPDIEVACLVHPERGKQDDPGGVLVLRITPALALVRSQRLGRAGALSEGVGMARGSKGLELVWHDGSPDAQRVWWASLADGEASAQVMSQNDRLASAPAITALSGVTVMAWAENWLRGDDLVSRIVYWDHRAAPKTLIRNVHVAASPQLLALGDQLVLGFRDRRAGAKTGLYLARIADRGAQEAEAVRVGRADGVGRPALTPCMDGVIAATPRTYGGDYFVGINWLDRALQRARGEQQFYEDAHAFTQVAGACLGSRAVLLIAEFPQLHRASAALRAVPYTCR